MSEIINSEAGLRRRRFLIVLPILVIPFLTLTFWLLGGGIVAQVQNRKTKSGLNTQLPGSVVNKDSSKDKMSFYNSAAIDSFKRMEQMRMDPYRKDSIPILTAGSTKVTVDVVKQQTRSVPTKSSEDDQLYQRVQSIQRQLSQNRVSTGSHQDNDMSERTIKPKSSVPVQNVAIDPEMEALSGMLDKIAAIQHPEKNSNTFKPKENTYSVSMGEQDEATFFGKQKHENTSNTFHSDNNKQGASQAAIKAIIPSAQVLQSGSVVKLELVTTITIAGNSLPAGSNLFGIATLEGERLMIRVPCVRKVSELLPVNLSVYDMDGLEGIFVPGSVSLEVMKQSADNAIQSTGINGFDMSLKTRAAAAGISAAKSLLSKKVKQVRVSIAAGYQVLLVDKNQKL